MRIVLASQSLFRAHALEVLGLEFEKTVSNFDEKSIRDEDVYLRAKKLAEAKARSVAPDFPDAIIVAGDMFNTLDGEILEKPKDEEEAFEMLTRLSGGTSECIGSLAVYDVSKDKMLSTVSVCEMTFRKLLEEEIRDYISKYPVTKFAAAFDNEGVLRFSEKICGSYNFRTGLPVNDLVMFLREFGVAV